MTRRAAASIALVVSSLAGCSGAATTTTTAAEPTLATRTSLSRATAAPGERVPGGAVTTRIVEGEDVARAVLFELLDALITTDVEAMRRLLGEAPMNVHAIRASRNIPEEFVLGRREAVVQRLVLSQRAARMPEGIALRDVVRPSDVEISPAHRNFPDGVPGGLEPGDLIVRFHVDESAGRALQVVAAEGRGLIIVRVGTDGAHIVGL